MEEHFFKFSNLSKFPEVIHGFSKRNYGSMKFGDLPPEKVIENRQHFFKELGIDIADIIAANLAHGSEITTVGLNEKGRGSLEPTSAIPATDGLITSQAGIYLMATFADCLPIMVYDPSAQVVALIHGGWRSIIDQIVPKLIDKMKNLGSEVENFIVGIGPGICQKHFVVKDDVLAKFKAKYPSMIFVRNKDGYIDLKKAVVSDLRKSGVPKENLEVASECTVCLNGIYGSFRKEGDQTIYQAAILGMKK